MSKKFKVALSVGVLLIAVGGLLLYRQSMPTRPPVEQNRVSTPPVAEGAKVSWQLFQSEPFGFSFRHPENWQVKNTAGDANTSSAVFIVSDPSEKVARSPNYFVTPEYLWITIKPVDASIGLEELERLFYDDLAVIEKQRITFAGMPAGQAFVGGINKGSRNIYFKKGSMFYEIAVHLDDYSDALKPTIDEVVGSFHFN